MFAGWSERNGCDIPGHLHGVLTANSRVLIMELAMSNPPPASPAQTDTTMLSIEAKERARKD